MQHTQQQARGDYNQNRPMPPQRAPQRAMVMEFNADMEKSALEIDAIMNTLPTGVVGNGEFSHAIKLAVGLNRLRQYVHGNELIKSTILSLANTRLGFLTDRSPAALASQHAQLQAGYRKREVDPPYTDYQIVECAIEAMLDGYRVLGNEFNIIAGSMMPVKNGKYRRILEWPGLSNFFYEIYPPDYSQEVVTDTYGNKKPKPFADIKCTAVWELDGETHFLGVKKEIGIRVRLAVDAGTSGDSLAGKAESRLFTKILTKLTGRAFPETAGRENGEVVDLGSGDYAAVMPEAHEPDDGGEIRVEKKAPPSPPAPSNQQTSGPSNSPDDKAVNQPVINKEGTARSDAPSNRPADQPSNQPSIKTDVPPSGTTEAEGVVVPEEPEHLYPDGEPPFGSTEKTATPEKPRVTSPELFEKRVIDETPLMNRYNALLHGRYKADMSKIQGAKFYLGIRAQEMVRQGHVATVEEARRTILENIVESNMADHFFEMFERSLEEKKAPTPPAAETEEGDEFWEGIRAIWFPKRSGTFKTYIEENVALLKRSPAEHQAELKAKYHRLYGRPCQLLDTDSGPVEQPPDTSSETSPSTGDDARILGLLQSVPTAIYLAACRQLNVVPASLLNQPYEVKKRVFDACVLISESQTK